MHCDAGHNQKKLIFQWGSNDGQIFTLVGGTTKLTDQRDFFVTFFTSWLSTGRIYV